MMAAAANSMLDCMGTSISSWYLLLMSCVMSVLLLLDVWF
jgi:hypothetical protein